MKTAAFILIIVLAAGTVYAADVGFSHQRKLVKVRSTGLEHFLFYNFTHHREGSNMVLEFNVNRTVYLFLRDAYLNPTVGKCRTIQRVLEPWYPNISCLTIQAILQDYVVNGWGFYQNGIERGVINTNAGHIEISIPLIRLRDRIRLGRHSIVFIYQDEVVLVHNNTDFNTTVYINFDKNVTGEWVNVFENISIIETNGGFKFYANDTESNETTLNTYRLKANSTALPFYMNNNSLYFFRNKAIFKPGLFIDRTLQSNIFVEDVCDGVYYYNLTYMADSNCQLNYLTKVVTWYDNESNPHNTTVDDWNHAEVVFQSNAVIDPTVTVTDISDLIIGTDDVLNTGDTLSLDIGETDEVSIPSNETLSYLPLDRETEPGKTHDRFRTSAMTTNNGGVFEASGYYDKGYRFNQSNTYLYGSSWGYDNSHPLTMMFWLNASKATSSSGSMIFYDFLNIFGGGFHIDLNDTGNLCVGYNGFYGSPTACSVKTEFVFPTNEWIHVAMRINGSRGYFFINGEENQSGAFSPSDAGWEYYLGASATPVDYYGYVSFNGTIDDVIVIQKALNQSEIQGFMNHTIDFTEYNGTALLSPISIGKGVGEDYLNVTVNKVDHVLGEKVYKARVWTGNYSDYNLTYLPSGLIYYMPGDNNTDNSNKTHYYDLANETHWEVRTGAGQPVYQPGILFESVYFDGNNAWITNNDSYQYGPFTTGWPDDWTACVWAKVDCTHTKNQSIFGSDDIQRHAFYWGFMEPNCELWFHIMYGGKGVEGYVPSAIEPPDYWHNTWYHFCIVVDGNGVDETVVDTYYNGRLLKRQNYFDQAIVEMNKDPFTIGGNWGGGSGSDEFKGSLDEFMVWDRKLSQDEILDVYYGSAINFTSAGGWISFIGDTSPYHYLPPEHNAARVELWFQSGENKSYCPMVYGDLNITVFDGDPCNPKSENCTIVCDLDCIIDPQSQCNNWIEGLGEGEIWFNNTLEMKTGLTAMPNECEVYGI